MSAAAANPPPRPSSSPDESPLPRRRFPRRLLRPCRSPVAPPSAAATAAASSSLAMAAAAPLLLLLLLALPSGTGAFSPTAGSVVTGRPPIAPLPLRPHLAPPRPHHPSSTSAAPLAAKGRPAETTAATDAAAAGAPERPYASSTTDDAPRELENFRTDIGTKLNRDLSSDSFGPLRPVAEKIDEATGGWALSYADLHPETPQTPAGVAFLATNACYAVGGLALGVRGEWTLGALTEVAGIVSFWYHYSQLEFGQDRREVRLALLIDYLTAGSALLTGGAYMVGLGIEAVPDGALLWGAVSVVCLTLCWVREFGYWYLFWHSLWHVGSAYTGYLVGQAHLTSLGGSMVG